LALVPVLLSGLACGLPAQGPTTDQIILEPTLAPPQPASPTPAPTSPPAADIGPASSAFRDDFEGALDSGWSWFKSDSPGWSLDHTPGRLRMNLSYGGFLSATPPENLLLRPAPSGDFSLRTFLLFYPHNNFEFAGLVVVFDDHSVLQFGRGGCFLETPSAACIGDGMYFDNIRNSSAVGGNFASPAALGIDYVLRLERVGNTYTASYSTDESNWLSVGSHVVDLTPASVGLIAAQATVAQPYADFDYFELTDLP
jgi:beta-xylosidase